jgi:hypothetical protein
MGQVFDGQKETDRYTIGGTDLDVTEYGDYSILHARTLGERGYLAGFRGISIRSGMTTRQEAIELIERHISQARG